MREATVSPAIDTGLDRLFGPRSIAIVGGSRNPDRFGGRPLAALRRGGFQGNLHWVGDRPLDQDGLDTAPTIGDLPPGIDLVVLLTPAQTVPGLIDECGRIDAAAAVVMSGGFGEAGGEGEGLQARLEEAVDGAGIRLLGPNCPGFVNFHERVACSASGFAVSRRLVPGSISLLSQSGAVAGVLADRALSAGIGLGSVICTGNQLDVEIGEAAQWVAGDPRNRVLGLFVESLGRDARTFERLEAVRRAGMPIVAMGTGASPPGREVVASHTGGIAGDSGTWEAICADLGIVRAEGYDELLEAASLLAMRRPVGRRLAVVGASGGMSAVLADAASRRGLELPELSEETTRALERLTPSYGRSSNPLDLSSSILTEPDRLGGVAEIAGADPAVDSVVVVVVDHPPDLSLRIADVAVAAAARCRVPMVLQWSAGDLSWPGMVRAAAAGLPVLTEPERLARTMSVVDAGLRPPRVRAAGGEELPAPPSGELSEHQVKGLLAALGLDIPAGVRLADPAEAGAVGPEGPPIVIKADVVGVAHKVGIEAVRVGVPPSQACAVADQVHRSAIAELGRGRVRGVLFEQLIDFLAELLVSVRADRHVGAVVTVGAGGAAAEAIADSSSRIAPVDLPTAREMILELALAPALIAAGPRRVDIEALAEVVSLVSRLGALWPELALLELNPVAARADGAVVLDAAYRPRARGEAGR